uniref:Letm1 RBD domain-containing protein n=1 Tax=Electrophorus electricus TaxID=8005 RepID=A0AAY5EJ40_ELEEL
MQNLKPCKRHSSNRQQYDTGLFHNIMHIYFVLHLRIFSTSCYSTSPARLGILKRVTEKYERVLEQRFPRFYVLYHTLMRGFQLLFEDVKEIRRIRRNICRNSIHYRQLPYREMERLILFRRDMIKAIPLAVISLPPFGICLVFILMCLFPRQLLFQHFWSPQQQRKFQMISHLKRSEHQAQILRNIASTAPHVSNWSQRTLLQNLCAKVQSGAHPDVSELHAVREVFSGPLLRMQSLKPSHLVSVSAFYKQICLPVYMYKCMYTLCLYICMCMYTLCQCTFFTPPPPFSPFYILSFDFSCSLSSRDHWALRPLELCGCPVSWCAGVSPRRPWTCCIWTVL